MDITCKVNGLRQFHDWGNFVTEVTSRILNLIGCNNICVGDTTGYGIITCTEVIASSCSGLTIA